MKLNCILLVDDDVATNELHQMVINVAGAANKVQVALNGKEALDYLSNSGSYAENGPGHPQPDLILLDINMPLMNGFEFMEEYAKLPAEQKGKIVVVMLTTSLNPDDRTSARNYSDIKEFQHKPLTVDMLNEMLNRFFGYRLSDAADMV